MAKAKKDTNGSGLQSAPIIYGERFGRLLVISSCEDESGNWTVKCDCGAEFQVRSEDLLRKSGPRRCGKRTHQGVSPTEASARLIYGRYKYRARSRNIPFEIPYLAFKEEISWHCAYCDASPANGIDQVNSGRGYLVGNTVACCWKCNRAKSVMTQKEFIAWIKRAAEKMHTSIWGSAHPVSQLLAQIEEQRAKGQLPPIIRMLEELDSER